MLCDSLLDRSERLLFANGAGNGAELWRQLFMEGRGSSQELTLVKGDRYQNPDRINNLEHLWEGLDKWIALGDECAGEGLPLPDGYRALALKRLLPTMLVEKF